MLRFFDVILFMHAFIGVTFIVSFLICFFCFNHFTNRNKLLNKKQKSKPLASQKNRLRLRNRRDFALRPQKPRLVKKLPLRSRERKLVNVLKSRSNKG